MKFLKNVLAVFTGLIAFSVLVVIAFSIIIMVASQEKPVDVAEHTVLHLKLDKRITERETNDPFASLVPVSGIEENIGLVELRRAIKHAKDDDKIEGIFLEVPFLRSGIASAMEIRNMLADFKSSGKFIVAYADFYSEGGYYVASVADEIYMAPDFGMLEFNGLSSERIYFKGTLDKLGIQPVIFRAGKYKNAAEAFVASEMSETEKEQVAAYVQSIYGNLLSDISEWRNIPVEKLRNIADSMLIRKEEDAVKYKLIDKLAYQNEVREIVKEKAGVEKDEELELISHSTYNQSFQNDYSSRNAIGVLVATGNIVSGKGTSDNISSEEFVEELKKLRESDRIKAVVLRVNSPGGSALASDLIWKEVKLTAQKKPVIASMSDVAASGGYYIAMAADTIMAMPTTITGSIGVIGMYFNLNDLLNEKLGITSDNYQTGRYADLLNVARPVSEEEVKIVQQMIDDSYRIFAGKAAKDRNMKYEDLHEVAQGRVWTGEDALGIGLIDMQGNLEDAIKVAAEKAGVAEDYRVKYYPERRPFIEQLLVELGGGEQETAFINNNLPGLKPYLRSLLQLKDRMGIQARLPYDLNIIF